MTIVFLHNLKTFIKDQLLGIVTNETVSGSMISLIVSIIRFSGLTLEADGNRTHYDYWRVSQWACIWMFNHLGNTDE